MARRTENRSVRTTAYRTEIEGTSARVLHAVTPQRQDQIGGPEEVHRRKRRAESNTLSIPYCIFLTLACVLTLIMGSYYLQQQALSTSSQKKIASLESELAELKKVNADDLNRIETSVNLEEIRDIAINELGMIYATQENVVLYKNTSQNYVSQYDDVPQEAESLIKSIIKSK